MVKGPAPKPFSSFCEFNPFTGCWIWGSTVNKSGYGLHLLKRKRMSAHRVSWIIHKGSIPNGMFVLHKCDVRECVNPEHLFLGTQKDNMQDCIRKGRFVKTKLLNTHCPSGHEFTPENTYMNKRARVCRICTRVKAKAYRDRKAH